MENQPEHMTPEERQGIALKTETMVQMLQIIADASDRTNRPIRAWQARQAIHNLRQALLRIDSDDLDGAGAYFETARGFMERLCAKGQEVRA